jgi:hypothetical protein
VDVPSSNLFVLSVNCSVIGGVGIRILVMQLKNSNLSESLLSSMSEVQALDRHGRSWMSEREIDRTTNRKSLGLTMDLWDRVQAENTEPQSNDKSRVSLVGLFRLKQLLAADRSCRVYNIWLSLWSLGSWLSIIVITELRYDSVLHKYTENNEAYTISLGLNVAAIVTLVLYYRVKARTKKQVWGYESSLTAFIKSDLKFSFLIELFILIVQPLPFNSVPDTFEEMVMGFMSLRFYLILRVLRNETELYQQRYVIGYLGGNQGSFSRFYHINSFAIFKSVLMNYTGFVLFTLISICLASLGYAIFVIERPLCIPLDPLLTTTRCSDIPEEDLINYEYSPFTDMSRAIYFVLVCMTTVGFGDYFASSTTGRFWAILSTIIGIVLSSFTVGAITNALIMNPVEKYIVSWRNTTKYNSRFFNRAVLSIQTWWRLKRTQKTAQAAKVKQILDLQSKLKRRLLRQREARTTAFHSESLLKHNIKDLKESVGFEAASEVKLDFMTSDPRSIAECDKLMRAGEIKKEALKAQLEHMEKKTLSGQEKNRVEVELQAVRKRLEQLLNKKVKLAIEEEEQRSRAQQKRKDIATSKGIELKLVSSSKGFSKEPLTVAAAAVSPAGAGLNPSITNRVFGIFISFLLCYMCIIVLLISVNVFCALCVPRQVGAPN